MEKELRHGHSLSSALCSPGRSSAAAASASVVSAYFFSAPASPTHFLLSSAPAISAVTAGAGGGSYDLGDSNFEFGLSARGAMSTADELFVNGQIRSGFASPVQDLDQMARNGSVHRRTRSVSPTRSPRFNWRERRKETSSKSLKPINQIESKSKSKSDQADPDLSVSTSASTSRSSSSSSSTSSNPSSRNLKRWTFIKDLFRHRSKSEGNQNRNRPTTVTTAIESRNPRSRNYNKNTNKSAINGSFSPVLYKERAVLSGQVEEMRRRTTFLPYRPGLLFGCLGFRRYGAIDGFARNISSVSSSR